jgi:hypothetical protein
MTDREAFDAMLCRAGIAFRVERPDDGVGVSYTIDNRSDHVNTFAHCFCEFRFTPSGKLDCVSYGY